MDMDRERLHAYDLDSGGLCAIDQPSPSALIIFGASGDLTRRKLIPALFRLYRNRLLPPGFFVLGVARSAMDEQQFREQMAAVISQLFPGECDEQCLHQFISLLHYLPLEYGDLGGYRERLARALPELEKNFATDGRRVFYLATPPAAYEPIIGCLHGSGLSAGSSEAVKIVIEKPFGRDLESARRLNSMLRDAFREEQIYRIDHYLAKETVQNILMFRFANSIFEPIWNRRYIDHVQITAAETLGIEQRAGYYEDAGVLRDMFQNHMFQLLAMTAMEPPATFNAVRVRDEKAKVFQSIRPFPLDRLEDCLATGQYGPGLCDGQPVRGYREEAGVAHDSRTLTYAALKVHIDNWRWNGVPFYLRSGKRLRSRQTEITFHYRAVPHMMFAQSMTGRITPNALHLRVQPDEGITLEIQTKVPGSRVCLNPVSLDFSYRRDLELDAYAWVLVNCMEGDQMMFVRDDGVDLSWQLLSPLIERLDFQDQVPFYSAGSDGPDAAARLLARDGRTWNPL